MAEVLVGIDLGGTNIKIGLFDGELNLIAKTAAPTDADMGPEFVVERIVEKTGELLGKDDSIAAVGIGTPGPANYPEGVIIRSPNMPKFKDTPLRDMIADKLGAPAILENDANAACWGEFVMGAGRGLSEMVSMTLGTGVGGGVVSNGELVRGFGGNAGEIGHVMIYPNGRVCGCGQKGCFEAYASAKSTAARAREEVLAQRTAKGRMGQSSLEGVLKEKGAITCEDVFEHAAAGDGLARVIVEGTAKAIAIMCVNMLHVTEPARIILSGGMIAAGQVLLDRVRHHFAEQIWPIKEESLEICFAELGEDAGIIGAAALAKHAREQGKL